MIGSPTDGPTAVVYDIQRLSLNDGPGIRTTVFLKGCPLRCAWCHNPESWERQPRLAYNEALCRNCGECRRVCPNGVFVHRIDWSLCDACGKCVDACPHEALEISGRELTVQELLSELETDRPYYEIGEKGGVTLSGGEPLASFDFVEAFLMQKGNLHVCLETSGFASSEHIRRLSPLVDLFLFDWKISSTAKHQKFCGVDNRLIMTNLRLLCQSGAKVLLRLPLVPGVNDDQEHLSAVATLLKDLPEIQGAQILPYHSMGSAKETRFGLEGRTLKMPDLGLEQAATWMEKLQGLGASNVFF